jgi:hypothetical protein
MPCQVTVRLTIDRDDETQARLAVESMLNAQKNDADSMTLDYHIKRVAIVETKETE